MTTGYRFRAYPSDAVAGVLLRWIGCQRFIYNAKVREDRYYRAFARRFAALAGVHPPVDQAYAHFIGDGAGNEQENTMWLRLVPSHVLRNGAVRWYQGYQRFFKGVARRPTQQHRHGEQSVWLTSELFEFTPAATDAEGIVTAWRLRIGTKKFPCGELSFVDHRPGWTLPASIHVSVNAGRWHVSFSNETPAGSNSPSDQDVLDRLRQFTRDELLERTVGLDRGVAVPLMAAAVEGAFKEGRRFELLKVHRERLAKKELQRKRWHRRAARRVPGSKNRRKANLRATRAGLYAADVRQDFAHQASRALVDSPAQLFVFEALQVIHMSRSAASTVAEPGTKVAQKRGLNRAILASAWGDTKLFTRYKAVAAGKLCIEVPPYHSSQECSACGHTHADNRLSQALFVCKRCGHAENADLNAARVIACRGAAAVATGSYTLRQKKKVGSLRRIDSSAGGPEHVGPERSEPSRTRVLAQTPVETPVSRRAPTRATRMSTKQEIPGASQEAPTTARSA